MRLRCGERIEALSMLTAPATIEAKFRQQAQSSIRKHVLAPLSSEQSCSILWGTTIIALALALAESRCADSFKAAWKRERGFAFGVVGLLSGIAKTSERVLCERTCAVRTTNGWDRGPAQFQFEVLSAVCAIRPHGKKGGDSHWPLPKLGFN